MTSTTRLIAVLLLLAAAAYGEPAPPRSAAEVAALEQLASKIDGAVIYTRRGRVLKVTIGQWEPVDLGEGTFARWSADGQHIAVYHQQRVYVMRDDGSDRRELAQGDHINCSPVEFHSDNRSIIYLKKDSGFWRVNIESGVSTAMNLPDVLTGEPGISGDGTRMVARGGEGGGPLCAVDLVTGAMRQYARGCSPGISPDGQWVMNNVGSHRELEIRKWDGADRFTIDTRTAGPDRRWDDHHWSNHNDYITAQGEGAREDAYVVCVSANRVTRVSWEGHVRGPDLFVKAERNTNHPAGADASN